MQVQDYEDEALRREDAKSLHAMGLDAGKLKELRANYGSEERGGPERIADARPAHRKRSSTRCRPLTDGGRDAGREPRCLRDSVGRTCA